MSYTPTWRDQLDSAELLLLIENGREELLTGMINEFYIDNKYALLYKAISRLYLHHTGHVYWKWQYEQLLTDVLRYLLDKFKTKTGCWYGDIQVLHATMLEIISHMRIYRNDDKMQQLFEEIASVDISDYYSFEDYGWYSVTDWHPRTDLTNLQEHAAERLRSNTRIMRAYKKCGENTFQKITLLKSLRKKSDSFWKEFASNSRLNIRIWKYTITQIKNRDVLLEVLNTKLPNTGRWSRYSIEQIIKQITENKDEEQINYLLLNAKHYLVQTALINKTKSIALVSHILQKTKSIIVRKRAMRQLESLLTQTSTQMNARLIKNIVYTRKYVQIWENIIPHIRENHYEYYKEILNYKIIKRKCPWTHRSHQTLILKNLPVSKTDDLIGLTGEIFESAYEDNDEYIMLDAYKAIPKTEDRIAKIITKVAGGYRQDMLDETDEDTIVTFVINQNIDYISTTLELLDNRYNSYGSNERRILTEILSKMNITDLQTMILADDNQKRVNLYRKKLKIRLDA